MLVPKNNLQRTLILCLLFTASFATINGREKVALVLSGGGAKGAAEIGVLKYIEESQVPIDYIVGTSIGAVIGGLYAVGYNATQLDSLFRSQDWLSLLTSREISNKAVYSHDSTGTQILGFPVARKKTGKTGWGLMHGDSILSKLYTLTNRCDSFDFSNLKIPFKCVAVDANTFQEIVLERGILPLCMRASMSIPFLYKPVKMDSTLLADGGLINNLPVDVAREMGADIVIAVDLTQKQRAERKSEMKLGKNPMLNLIQWSIGRPDLKKYNRNIKDADIYIRPNLKGYHARDFDIVNIMRMIRQGEYAGRKAMPELKKLRKKLADVQ